MSDNILQIIVPLLAFLVGILMGAFNPWRVSLWDGYNLCMKKQIEYTKSLQFRSLSYNEQRAIIDFSNWLNTKRPS